MRLMIESCPLYKKVLLMEKIAGERKSFVFVACNLCIIFLSFASGKFLWQTAMCPLRFILIFLSATLAGFLVLRNLKSAHSPDSPPEDSPDTPSTSDRSQMSKFRAALVSVFWAGVDMASGRYLWRHFVPPSSSSKRDD